MAVFGRKKRICIVIGSHWAARIGGAQYQVRCLLGELQKRDGIEIFYLTRNLNPSYKPVGYKIIKVSDAKGIRRHAFFFDTTRLLNLLKGIKPDIIYQRGFNAYTGVTAYFARRNNCKMVWHISHEYDVSPFRLVPTINSVTKFIDRKIGEYGIRNSDYIIAQTKEQRNLLERNYGRWPTAIMRNFHPFPVESLEKRPPMKIVWIGNFKQTKRPELFERLAKDISHLDEIEFIMIGRTGSRAQYRELSDRIQRTKNINYLGECSIEEVNGILAEAHIFVSTSVAEGFPNTFIQAWMRKVPVMSIDVNVDGIFDDRRLGLYASSYEELRENVIKLIKDPDLRETMGNYAQDYAFKYHSLANAKDLVSLLCS
jgi:glycosyltransferase involved in cell wall biosynthesis